MMNRLCDAAFAIAVLAAPAAAQIAPATHAPATLRDAREQVSPGLLGPWKVDLAASTYTGSKPRVATRTFQYTADGKVLVTFQTVDAAGVYATGHWAAQVDGTPAIEYHSRAGAIPYNVVSFRKVDETSYQLTVTRNGVRNLEATYQLAPDGQTLTYRYDGNVIVYRRWDKLD